MTDFDRADLMTRAEVAEAAGLSIDTIAGLTAKMPAPVAKVTNESGRGGRQSLWRRSEIEAWVASRGGRGPMPRRLGREPGDDLHCEICGVPIAPSKRGPKRRVCSPACRARRWTQEHASTPEGALRSEYVRRLSAARSRALRRLQDAHPDLYRIFYEEELAIRGVSADGIITEERSLQDRSES